MKSDLANHVEMILSKKIKIGRDHLAAFKIISLFWKHLLYQYVQRNSCTEKNENGNT